MADKFKVLCAGGVDLAGKAFKRGESFISAAEHLPWVKRMVDNWAS